MRALLDFLFANKKAAIIIPLISALSVYVLFIIFGESEEKLSMIIITPIASVIWFFGVFFVIFLQVKNTSCPEWLLNLFELLAVAVFCLGSAIDIVKFVFSGFQNFGFGICLGIVTYGAVSWAHSKRSSDI